MRHSVNTPLETATYLTNRSPTSAVPKYIPAELWYGKRQNVSHLKVFGSLVYIHVPQEIRKKLDGHVEKAAIVGIRNSGYFVWNEKWGRIIYTRDVVRFDERKMYMST